MAFRLESFDDFAKLPKPYLDLIDACAPTFDQTQVWFRTFAEYLLDADSRLLLIGVSDAEGRALANGGDAALSGLLAWSVWYAVHALGERP